MNPGAAVVVIRTEPQTGAAAGAASSTPAEAAAGLGAAAKNALASMTRGLADKISAGSGTATTMAAPAPVSGGIRPTTVAAGAIVVGALALLMRG